MLSSSARAESDGRGDTAVRGTVALLPLLGSNLALDELAAVDATVQREVDAWYGARSVPAATVRERLDAGARRGLRCDRAVESCQAQLGIVCDTDLVLVAAVAPMATTTDESGAGGANAASGATSSGRLTLSLRLVDVAEAAQLAFAERTLPGLPSGDDVKALLASLDTPDSRKALLHVAGPAGAPVVVDGKVVDPLPWPGPIELSRGRHDVVVHTSPLFQTQVTLRRGERVDVAAPPNARVGALPASSAAPPKASSSTATPPVTGEPGSAEPAASMAGPGPSSKVLALAGGGTLTGVGALIAGVGVAPWFAYNAAGQQLQDKEGDFRAEENYLERGDNLPDLQATRREYDNNRASWQSYGQLAFASGIATAVVGATILGVGLFALE